jgi:hypothetical protein
LEIGREEFGQIIEVAELDPRDAGAEQNYSGQEIYGQAGVAVTVADREEANLLLVACGVILGPRRGIEMARRARMDHLGRELIVFFEDVEMATPADDA